MMFGLYGVIKPDLDVAGTTSRGDDYAELALVTHDAVSNTTRTGAVDPGDAEPTAHSGGRRRGQDQ